MPDWRSEILHRIAPLRLDAEREASLVTELEQHLDQHYADLIADGVPGAKARETVLAGLDDQAVLRDLRILPREELSRESAANWLRTPSSVTASFRVESIVQDLRYTLRQLRKNLGFAFTAVLVLALGISASVALFAFMDAALIKPLPYPDPTRLVDVTESAGALIARANLSYLDYLDWKKLNKVFSSLDVHTGSGYILRTSTGNDLVMGARVSDGFFRTLGVAPVLGQDFYPGEDLPNAPNTVILTYAAWPKRFGGKKDVIGQTVSLSEVPTTIIGVLPKEFQFAPRGDAEFWTTLHPIDSCTKRRSCHNLYGVARLKDGVPVQNALAEMTLIAKQLEVQYPDSNRGQGASVLLLSEVIVGKVRPILVVLLSGAVLLLVIACERRKSAAGAVGEPQARDGRAQCIGRFSIAIDSAVCNRRHGSRYRSEPHRSGGSKRRCEPAHRSYSPGDVSRDALSARPGAEPSRFRFRGSDRTACGRSVFSCPYRAAAPRHDARRTH
jgi:macrolide transport system ATP-binding/permease protein